MDVMLLERKLWYVELAVPAQGIVIFKNLLQIILFQKK